MKRARWVFGAAVATVAGGVMPVTAALALPFGKPGWSVGALVSKSDNINRVETDGKSETTAEVFVTVEVDEHRPRLDVDISADLTYREYFENSYEGGVVGGLDGNLSFVLVPEYLRWVVTDNFGQVRSDSTEVDTPANRQNFNYFSTGPDLTWQMTDLMLLNLSGRWSDAQFDDQSQFPDGTEPTDVQLPDNTRRSVSMDLTRALSRITSLSLHAGSETVEIKNASAAQEKYEVQEGSLILARNSTKFSGSVEGGYARITSDEYTTGGLLMRVSASYQMTMRSRLSFNAGTSYADSASALRVDQGMGGVGGGTSSQRVSADPFRADYGYLSWILEGRRTDLLIGATWRRDSHELITEKDKDSEFVGGQVELNRRMTSRFDIGVFGTYDTQESSRERILLTDPLVSVEQDNWSAGVSANWRANSSLIVGLRYEHFDGESNAPFSFEENRATLSVRYSRAR